MSEYLADLSMVYKTKLYRRQDTEVDLKQKTWGVTRQERLFYINDPTTAAYNIL